MSVSPSFSTVGPGYVFSGDRAQLISARVAYIKRHGANWLFAGNPPPVPGWPRPARPKSAPASTTRIDAKAEKKAVIAEVVSEGGAVSHAASILGVSDSYCQRLWREIVQEMGWQAS